MGKLWMGIAALLLFTGAHAANDKVIDKPLVAQSLDGFTREAGEIRAGMEPGGRYEFLKPAERSRVEARLNTMQALLKAHASQNDLNANDKVALANAQEEVNGILKHSDSNRLVCERRAPIGSNIPVTTCRTFGEMEQQRHDAMKGVSDMNQYSRQAPRSGG